MLILTIPLFNKEEFYGALPLPTKYNTGGFVYPNGTLKNSFYSYSPIDLAVASLIKPTKKIYNLRKWFLLNKRRPSENYVSIVYKLDNVLYSESVTEIKNRFKNWGDFEKIAPFTFKKPWS